MTLAGGDEGLVGCWFLGQKYDERGLPAGARRGVHPILDEAGRWLDLYFAGKIPDFMPKLSPQGTPFQKEVWGILRTIPYGKTMTYGEIAKIIAARRGVSQMSAQAVGGAVGHNPITIFIPCHRVMGADGKLTGYAGGIEKKRALLDLERDGRPIVKSFIDTAKKIEYDETKA